MKARIKLKRIQKFIHAGESVVDIGAGNCGLSHLLLKTNPTTPVDIYNYSVFEDCQVMIIESGHIPLANKFARYSLLLTVLHHVPKEGQERLIEEASRVSDELILIEDVYKNKIQKWLTHFFDSLNNGQFRGHPHSNRGEEEWEEIFQRLGWTIEHKKSQAFLLFFRQVTYHLKNL